MNAVERQRAREIQRWIASEMTHGPGIPKWVRRVSITVDEATFRELLDEYQARGESLTVATARGRIEVYPGAVT